MKIRGSFYDARSTSTPKWSLAHSPRRVLACCRTTSVFSTGQAVVVRNEEAVMSETGWLWGDQAYLGGPHLRIGANPLSAVYEVDQLGAQLARPTLVEDFFTGKPLPRPRVSTPPTEREEPNE